VLRALPNVLTLVRLPLAALVWIAPGSVSWMIGILAGAAVSDILDGWVARRVRQRRWEISHHPGSFAAGSGLGAFLDPLCDKIFVTSVLIALIVAYDASIPLVLAIATREILMAPAMIVFATVDGPWKRGHDFTAGWQGKVNTVLQFVAVAALLVYPRVFEALALACIPAGALTVITYVKRALGARRTPTQNI
jgi:cardiolipin synthase